MGERAREGRAGGRGCEVVGGRLVGNDRRVGRRAGLSVAAMASSPTPKSAKAAARQAAREAATVAQEQIAARTRRNTEDLTKFFAAQQRGATVDDWLTGRIAELRQQAEARKVGHRRAAGAALAAMRERGETVRDIAGMTGIGEKTARELIKLAAAVETAAPVEPASVGDTAGAGTAESAETADGPVGLSA